MHRKDINLQMRIINRCYNRSHSIIPVYDYIYIILSLKYIAATSDILFIDYSWFSVVKIRKMQYNFSTSP